MCNKKKGCQQPEKGTGDPRECSPEQIKECHGDVEGHPCEPAPRECEHVEDCASSDKDCGPGSAG